MNKNNKDTSLDRLVIRVATVIAKHQDTANQDCVKLPLELKEALIDAARQSRHEANPSLVTRFLDQIDRIIFPCWKITALRSQLLEIRNGTAQSKESTITILAIQERLSKLEFAAEFGARAPREVRSLVERLSQRAQLPLPELKNFVRNRGWKISETSILIRRSVFEKWLGRLFQVDILAGTTMLIAMVVFAPTGLLVWKIFAILILTSLASAGIKMASYYSDEAFDIQEHISRTIEN